MEDVITNLHNLEANFYRLQSEFCTFQSQVESSVLSEYNYSSMNCKLKLLENNINILKNEFENKLNNLPIQQTLNIYYLEHKENYDKEFYSIYELSYFIKESIYEDQDVRINIETYNTEFSYNISTNTYFQLSFLECKDYLIQVSCFDESLTGTSCKYCVNSEKLIKSIKEKIFDLTMTT